MYIYICIYIYIYIYIYKGWKLDVHNIITKLHSQILVIVRIVPLTCCYDETI